MNKKPTGWHRSQRRDALPKNWHIIRKKIELRAAGRCEKMIGPDQRCPRKGSECHHVGDPLDHSMGNLAWLCIECHMVETQKQAVEAARKLRDKASHPAARSTRKPPGLL